MPEKYARPGKDLGGVSLPIDTFVYLSNLFFFFSLAVHGFLKLTRSLLSVCVCKMT